MAAPELSCLESGAMAKELQRLATLVNELTLRCVLNGVDLPSELCPIAGRLPPPESLDVRVQAFVPWAKTHKPSGGNSLPLQDMPWHGSHVQPPPPPPNPIPVLYVGTQTLAYQRMIDQEEVPRSLQSLCLHGMSLSTGTIHNLLTQAHQIRSITLCQCIFGGKQFITTLSGLVNLTSLELRCCTCASAAAEQIMAAALPLPQLYALVLQSCNYQATSFKDEGMINGTHAIGFDGPCSLVALDIEASPMPSTKIEVLLQHHSANKHQARRPGLADDAQHAALLDFQEMGSIHSYRILNWPPH